MANMIEEEDQQVFELIPPFWKNKISLIDGTASLKRIFFNRFILITKKQTILQWIILPNSSYLKKKTIICECVIMFQMSSLLFLKHFGYLKNQVDNVYANDIMVLYEISIKFFFMVVCTILQK